MFKFFLILAFLTPHFLNAEEYRFSGDRSYSVIREGEEETQIEGNVIIESSERRIEADLIRIQGRSEKTFSGEGNVHIVDYDRDLIIRSGRFIYKEEISLLHVEDQTMLEDRGNGILVKCQRLDFHQDKDLVILQINVRIFKDDILCRSEYALYDREENTLELTGTPIVFKGEDRYEADRILVNLDTDEISMFGEIQGLMNTESQDEAENESDS